MVSRGIDSPSKKMVLQFVTSQPYIATLITPPICPPPPPPPGLPPNPINMTGTIHSMALIWQVPYIWCQYILNFFKETPHLILDTSKKKKSFKCVPFLEFWLIIRQILKSSIIKTSKYKVQDINKVIFKMTGFSGFNS